MKFTARKRQRFLEQIEGGASVKEAARSIAMSPKALYKRRAADDVLRQAWLAAAEIGQQVQLDEVEAEIRRRAIDGVFRPIVYQGVVRGRYKDYSDTLLKMMAMALAPHKYRERFDHQHSGPDGAPLNLTVEFVGMDEQADESGHGS
jgi:hypothetical protein